MLPDLDWLALFVRAAEMRNLTLAAEASLIAVPADSRLQLLDHQFNTSLCSSGILGECASAKVRLKAQQRDRTF